MTVLAEVLARRLRKMRIKRGMSQRELAVLLECSRGAISNYELGHNLPNLTQLMGICLELGCSADYMVGLIDKEAP